MGNFYQFLEFWVYLARITLDFLKKDWSDDEGDALKGAQLSGPVKVLLE